MAGENDTLEQLSERGSGLPAPAGLVALYHRAFRDFGLQALWNRQPSAHPTVAQVLATGETLRREGNMRSRHLAAEIEQACRAAL